MPWPLRIQRVDPSNRLLHEGQAGLLLLGARVVVPAEVDRSDEQRQAHAVAEQRHENDRDRDHDHGLSRGQRRAARQRERHRERGGQRDHAAHPRP